MPDDDNGYPRILDREGCLFGQQLEHKVEKLEERMDRLEKKIDRMTQALIGAAITLATATLMLGLNLVLR